jgi:hypothetical protein
MKMLRPISITFGVGAILCSMAALTLDKSLPYRIGFNDYGTYMWVGRLVFISVGLAAVALLCGIRTSQAWFPVILALYALAPLLFIGGAHSGNPDTWCYNNLRQIDGAKERLALERGLTNSSPVTMSEISRFMPEGQELRCAKHGKYIIGSIGSEPRCSIHGTIPEIEAVWGQATRAQPKGPTNRSQPDRLETNQPSPAAGSSR